MSHLRKEKVICNESVYVLHFVHFNALQRTIDNVLKKSSRNIELYSWALNIVITTVGYVLEEGMKSLRWRERGHVIFKIQSNSWDYF